MRANANMQIEKYLTRLGFQAVPRPDVATLRNLHCAHMLTVPFENLDIHLGRKIRKEICSRATFSGRITLSGTQLIETNNGSRDVVELTSSDERQDERQRALLKHFGISL
jgi:arylamine N-acetyltransferase